MTLLNSSKVDRLGQKIFGTCSSWEVALHAQINCCPLHRLINEEGFHEAHYEDRRNDPETNFVWDNFMKEVRHAN